MIQRTRQHADKAGAGDRSSACVRSVHELGYPDSSFDLVLRLGVAAGLEKIAGRTVGFGPFSVLGWKVLSDSSGVRVHRRLQQLADRGVPILRSMGTQYIVLARKGVATSAPPGR